MILVCENHLWKPGGGMKCVKISTLKIGWILFSSKFWNTRSGLLNMNIHFFKRTKDWILHALLRPIPSNSQKNQRNTQHWKKPNQKKNPPQGMHTHLLRSPISLLIWIVIDIIQLMLLWSCSRFCCTYLLISLAVQCVHFTSVKNFKPTQKENKLSWNFAAAL